MIQNFQLYILLMTILVCNLSANDGVYYSSGGNIYPTKETVISMHREVLTIKRVSSLVFVTVDFEFLNPTNQSKKVLVGFATPISMGDVNSDSLYINNYTVTVNGNAVESTFEPVYNNPTNKEEGVKEFVYLFSVNFQPGITKVYHSYNCPASGSVEVPYSFHYILQTALSWSKHSIKDFELILPVDFDGDIVGWSKHLFKNATIDIEGNGKIAPYTISPSYEPGNSNKITLASARNAQIHIRTKNFIPSKDLDIIWLLNDRIFASRFFYGILPQSFPTIEKLFAQYRNIDNNPTSKTRISRNTLSLLRNSIYAMYGYSFKDKALAAYFEKQWWYIPDERGNSVVESRMISQNKDIIEEIQAMESKK